MIYAYSADHLGFQASHFDVRKGNERVWQFHERFGARRTGETDLDYLYSIDIAALRESRQQHADFLPDRVTVIW
jgi:RimJ/RimL family protein N-acetyltransferase